MHQAIELFDKSSITNQKYSILIPSWNNLELLKLCLSSIKKNSHFSHQIIVIVNEGKDGTKEWVEAQGQIDYVYCETNIGICYGLNSARQLVKTDYIVYSNDDMYFLPDWDLEISNEIEKIGHQHFMLSATMIEPFDTDNPCVIVGDYGSDISTFNEEKLLKEYKTFPKKDWNGSTWPPNIIPLHLWDLVGGMSTEFSPGLYSDPDLSMKLWQLGVRYFKGLRNSRVYHFGSKSTRKAKMNNGKEMFLLKWGITSNFFSKKYLKRGAEFTICKEPAINILERCINKIKRWKALWF